MNDNDWKKEAFSDPWEQNVYQTGRTRPPKSRRGLLAFLMVAVIFLGGIVSAMGLLNIRLFRELNTGDGNPASVRFTEDEETGFAADASQPETQKPTTGKELQLQLNQTPLSVENVPQVGGLSLQQIYSKAIPSVVSVSCKTVTGTSTGTGVILSADGYVVTNSHVVNGALSVEIILEDGSVLAAAVIGADTVSDLAVLHVESTTLTPAEFGDASALRVGDSVVAIGDPLGIELRGTMTDGIVSAINRDISTEGRTMTLIQTNAALNSGNSGGPLLNCYGQVVGINTMKIGNYMSDSGVEGLGFAIPSTTVKEVVDQLIANGYVSGRAALGIAGEEISAFDQMYYRIPRGIYITEVEQGTDAAAKGLLPGDILLQVESTRITDLNSLKVLLYSYKAGDEVSVVIYRNGTQQTLKIKLAEAR